MGSTWAAHGQPTFHFRMGIIGDKQDCERITNVLAEWYNLKTRRVNGRSVENFAPGAISIDQG